MVKVWNRWLWPLGWDEPGSGCRQGSWAGPMASRVGAAGLVTPAAGLAGRFMTPIKLGSLWNLEQNKCLKVYQNVPSVAAMAEVGLNPKDKTGTSTRTGCESYCR